jgi:hypothetical protein
VDHWHLFDVRAAAPNVAQRWAQLEAKSPLMCEELARRYEVRKVTRPSPLSNATMYCELAAIAIKAWWCIYGG